MKHLFSCACAALVLSTFTACRKHAQSGSNSFSVDVARGTLDSALTADPAKIIALYGKPASGPGELNINVLFPGIAQSVMSFTLYDTMKVNQTYHMPFLSVYFGLSGSWLGSSSTPGYSIPGDTAGDLFTVTIQSWDQFDGRIMGTFSTGPLYIDGVGEFQFDDGKFHVFYTP